ncbi:hydrogenase maturation protease [Planktothrix agardhii 1801]|jgi:hydrogenase maturation protease|nr:hydrogenase maturation protease [Planktothrix agardhii]MCF3625745.1 hydrogenase maturation protease [Planktothrix agardhii 1801]
MILIVGYGNPIRGDDGVGQAVITEVEQWNLTNVRSLSIHQLTPAVAAEMAEVDTVIFVDAALEGDTVNIISLEALPSKYLKRNNEFIQPQLTMPNGLISRLIN